MAAQSRKSSAPSLFVATPVLNPAQLGGIETSILDNGPGRGVRIAWVNTGGGLRYKVLLDRGLDIADADFLGQSLTWLSFGGVTAPSPALHRGFEWLRGFGGGLVVGCGPVNVGDPFEEGGQGYSLHGTHSHTPATVESIINPDPAAGRDDMSITGIVRTARVFGPNIELRRTIHSRLGESSIHLCDAFTNRGNTECPFSWMLHINFGYPLLEPGHGTFCYAGRVEPAFNSDAWFERGDFRACPSPQEAHRGPGEVFAYIHPAADRRGEVTIGAVNVSRKLGVAVTFNPKDYPRFGNWQHWGPGGSYVGSLEPMTAGVEGWEADRRHGWFETLQPCEQRILRCTITATQDAEGIQALLRLNEDQPREGADLNSAGGL